MVHAAEKSTVETGPGTGGRQDDGPAADGIPSAAVLDDYPGPGLLLSTHGAVVAANAAGQALAARLAAGHEADVLITARLAAETGAVQTVSLSLATDDGEVFLEITAIPVAEPRGRGGTVMLLARDMTMNRNLQSALIDSRQRYKDLVEASADFYWETDAEGRFVFVTPRGALGHAAEDLVGRRGAELLAEASPGGGDPFAEPTPVEAREVRLRRADGEAAIVELSSLPLPRRKGAAPGDDAAFEGARGLCRDVTLERRQEAALNQVRSREQQLHYVVSMVRDQLEPKEMLQAAVDALAKVLGVEGAAIFRRAVGGAIALGAHAGAPCDLESARRFAADLDETPMPREAGELAFLFLPTQYRKNINGALCVWRAADGPNWTEGQWILAEDVANQLGIIIEQALNLERITKLSRTDALTGLLNRRAFVEDELPRRLNRLSRDSALGALFFVDLDNFKQVNDVHGHQRGDDALLAVRDMLLEFSRPGDLVARLGGDEFALWLDGLTEQSAADRATRLLDASEGLARFSGSPDKPLGVSVGIAMFDPAAGDSLDDLLARADTAMYAVKHGGKGGYRLARDTD